MVKNKLLYATIAAMLMGAVFTGCSNTHNNNTTTESQSIVSLEELASSADSDLSIELDDEDKVSSWDDSSASHIALGSQISSDSSSVEISGSTVTITKAGTLSNSLSNPLLRSCVSSLITILLSSIQGIATPLT